MSYLFGAWAYVLLTDMVCDEDTISNGSAMGGLSCTSRNAHVRFLGELGAVMPLASPT
ncbi:hypothetical protein H7K20_27825 [Priestia aryabhattai]|nr:hypothetical protein [Priestia aryabhattai]